MCFYQNLVLVAEYRVAVTSAVTNFRCHKLIVKINSVMKNFICNQYGGKLVMLNTEISKFMDE